MRSRKRSPFADRPRIFAAAALVLSAASVFAIGEVACRLLWPDEKLRYETVPTRLFRFRPNQTGILNLADGTPTPLMTTDEFGFRRHSTVAEVHRSVLVLGDSFAFGVGVRDHETFAARIDRALGPDVQVRNGAQPGYGIYQMLATLEDVFDKIRPELTIVAIWEGDLLRQPLGEDERAAFLRKSRFSKILKSSLLITQLYRRVEQILIRAGLDGIVLRVGETEVPAHAEALIEAHHRGLKADFARLQEINKIVREGGGKLLVVLWPKEGFASGAAPGLAELLTSELRIFADSQEFAFVSVQEGMASATGELVIPNDGHPTPLAHCLAAARIAVALRALEYYLQERIICARAAEPG